MAQVLVRNLDQAVVSRLKRKAEGCGLSLEAYLRDQLTQIAQPSRAEIVAELDALRAQSRPWREGDRTSVDYVQEGREERDAALTRTSQPR